MPSSKTPLSFVVLFLAALALASVPVLFPQLDLAVTHFFLDGQNIIGARPYAAPAWVVLVNEYTPDVFRSIFWLCLGLWGAALVWPRWRRHGWAIAFVGLSLGLGPGLLTWTAKEITLRARPIDVVEFGGQRQFTPALQRTNQCTDNCSFPSGHVGCGFFLAGLALLHPRRARRWMALGIIAGTVIGYARVSVGAHWLSDALWPFPIALAASWLVWKLLSVLFPQQAARTSERLNAPR